ncbi:hypothetical protein CDAR_115361 [Caerostris darwini]|uniref:Uncharacterized protein n=1 Tax=Caerostris darwini TaxID=1538125 RepID=A0AAV4U9V8_9ARAC|nr:hypothetical protein CDAR_115361 [Caerostris darwini]
MHELVVADFKNIEQKSWRAKVQDRRRHDFCLRRGFGQDVSANTLIAVRVFDLLGRLPLRLSFSKEMSENHLMARCLFPG